MVRIWHRKAYVVPAILLSLLLPRIASSEKAEKPNIILITVDGLRTDVLGCYGGGKSSTTAIDGLASQGVSFQNAFTVGPQTLPSHCSLMLSQLPFEHKVRADQFYLLDTNDPLLAEVLRDAGYGTAAFTGTYDLDSQYGLARGFDVYDDHFRYKTEAKFSSIPPRQLYQRRPGNSNRRAFEWLESRGSEPFFLWLNYCAVHLPKRNFSHKNGIPDVDEHNQWLKKIDEGVGELFVFLEKHKLTDNLLIVLTSSYGSTLGDSGDLEHGLGLSDSTLHIPLLFWSNRLVRKPGKIEQAATIIDVAPSLLELAGIPVPGSMRGKSMHREIKKKNRKGNKKTGKKAHYAETFLPFFRYGLSEVRAVRQGAYKYILSPKPELYFLEKDKGEETNLHGSEENIERKLRSTLIDLLNEEERKAVLDLKPAAGKSGRSVCEGEGEIRELAKTLETETSGQGSAETTEKTINKLCNDNRFNTMACLLKAEYYYRKRDRAKVESTLRTLLESMEILGFPPRAKEKPLLMLAVNLDIMRRADESRAIYKKIVEEINPFSITANRTLFRYYGKDKNIEGAVSHLKAMIERDPYDYEAIYALATVYLLTKEFDDAIRTFRTALSRGGQDKILAYLKLAEAFREKGDFADAVKICEEGLRGHPDWVKLHLVKGFLYLDQDEEEKARAEFEHARDKPIVQHQIHQALADWLEKKGRYKDAYQELVLAIGGRRRTEELEKRLEKLVTLIEEQKARDQGKEK